MSLPMTTRWRCSPRWNTSPAACPTFKASSAVILPFARPRMPSVPKYLRVMYKSPRRAANPSPIPHNGGQEIQKSLQTVNGSRAQEGQFRFAERTSNSAGDAVDAAVPGGASGRMDSRSRSARPRRRAEAAAARAVRPTSQNRRRSQIAAGLSRRRSSPRSRRRFDHALAGCFTSTPASVSIAASSPDWNISRVMSQPPTNSPLT